MYFRQTFTPARGMALSLLRRMESIVGRRERAILEAPEVEARRWPDSIDCIELRADTGSCVIRRGQVLTIVG